MPSTGKENKGLENFTYMQTELKLPMGCTDGDFVSIIVKRLREADLENLISLLSAFQLPLK